MRSGLNAIGIGALQISHSAFVCVATAAILQLVLKGTVLLENGRTLVVLPVAAARVPAALVAVPPLVRVHLLRGAISTLVQAGKLLGSGGLPVGHVVLRSGRHQMLSIFKLSSVRLRGLALLFKSSDANYNIKLLLKQAI